MIQFITRGICSYSIHSCLLTILILNLKQIAPIGKEVFAIGFTLQSLLATIKAIMSSIFEIYLRDKNSHRNKC